MISMELEMDAPSVVEWRRVTRIAYCHIGKLRTMVKEEFCHGVMRNDIILFNLCC